MKMYDFILLDIDDFREKIEEVFDFMRARPKYNHGKLQDKEMEGDDLVRIA